MFEGISKYVIMLIIIYFITLIVKKREMSKIFKKALKNPKDAYIPFLCTKTLISVAHSNEKLFYQTFVPFLRINAYIKIYEDLLKTFGQDIKEASKYYFMPMVYFTKLGSGDARVEIHDYDLKNEYLESQEMLYEPAIGEVEKPLYEMTDPGYYIPEKEKEKIVYKVTRRNNVNKETILDIPSNEENSLDNIEEEKNISANDSISPEEVSPVLELPKEDVNIENPYEEIVRFNQSEMKNEINNIEGPSTVFTDDTLIPDERMEKVVEAVNEEKVETSPIHENVKGRPKMCPKCGAILAPSAEVCFLCGTHL